MKKITCFKTVLPRVIIICSILFHVLSCSNQDTKETKKINGEYNQAKSENGEDDPDEQFLVYAAETNLEEIRLGQLAQQNGMLKEVKELGKMLEEDHTKLMNDLTKLADKRSIKLPSSPDDNTLNTYAKLSAKSGTVFDKKYCNFIISAHKDAITVFKRVSAESDDSDIRVWATETLTGLRKHLDDAVNCQKRCDKM